MAARIIEKTLAATKNTVQISDASHQTHQQTENNIHAIKEVLAFRARVVGVNSFYGKRFISKIVSIEFTDDFGTDFITGSIELHTSQSGPRERLETGL